MFYTNDNACITISVEDVEWLKCQSVLAKETKGKGSPEKSTLQLKYRNNNAINIHKTYWSK